MPDQSLARLAARLHEAYRQFLKTEFWFHHPDLRRSFAEALDRLELLRGPYLELAPRYRRGMTPRVVFEELLRVQVDSGFLAAVRGDRPLYCHQEDALRHVWSGRNIVVATGTGSGKTEAFLLPILLTLYQEWLEGQLGPGTRALILYPMNALAFDQRERLAEIARVLKECGSPFHLTFGQYTGNTPYDAHDKRRGASDWDDRRRAYTIIEDNCVVHGELIYRDEMRKTPPHILITNYSMLEYLLIRPDDSPLFDNEAGRNWRFLVIDEAHTYSGVRGQELALLIRRLKERLRRAGNEHQFRCIATSATLFTGAEAREQAAEFASRLFGEPFERDSVLLGEPAGLLEGLEGGLSSDMKRAGSRLEEVLRGGVKTFHEIAEEIFPNERDVDRAYDRLLDLLEVLSDASQWGGESPIAGIRFHLFVRGLEGAYLRFNPVVRLTLANESDALGKAFEVALCRICGQHYLVGRIVGSKFTAANRDYSSVDFGVHYLLPLERVEDDEVTWLLCPRCGALLKGEPCSCGFDGKSIPVKFDRDAHNLETGELRYCLVCHSRVADPVREIVYGGEWPQAVLATTVLEALPAERQKILAFADGRQDAAYFAVRMDEWVSDLATRRAIARILSEVLEGEVGEGLSLRDLHARLLASGWDLNDLPEAGSVHERKRRIWEMLLRELRLADDNRSLASAGIGFWRLGWTRWHELPTTVVAQKLGVSEERAIEVVEQLVLSLVTRNVLAIDLLGADISHDEFVRGYVRVGSPASASDVESWDGFEHGNPNRRVDYLVRALRRSQPDLPEQDARSRACEVLREIWDWIRRQDEGRRESDRLFVHRGKGCQLNPLWLRLVPVQQKRELYRCDRCGRLASMMAAGICSRYRCPGVLMPVSSLLEKKGFYTWVYKKSGPIQRFRVAEHTAQLTAEKAQEYQYRFSRGELHLLSSSTTFELGVDLGDIDVVFMRNVPPEPFNYRQRAGRVGRRQRAGFVLTFCRRRPHDLYHFLRPERLLSGEVRTTIPRHWSDRLVQRHVNAVVFAEYFRAYPERFQSVEDLIQVWQEPKLVSDIRDFIGVHSGELQQRVDKILADVLADSWPPSLAAAGLLDAVTRSDSVLARAVAEVCEDYRVVCALEESARLERKYRDADWAKRRAETIAREDVLSFLSRKAVIPKYGFPVDVVELTLPEELRDIELTRDLRIAVSEYAPGQVLVANKHHVESVGVKIVPDRALPRKVFRYCREHGSYVEGEYGSDMSQQGLICGCKGRGGEYVQPMFGFFGRTAKERRSRPGQALPSMYFVHGVAGDDVMFREYGDPACLRVSAVSRRPVVVISTGKRGRGFLVCPKCGRWFSDHKGGAHKGRDGRECLEQASRVALGHSFLTDVVRLDFLLDPPREHLVSLNYGLVAALVIGVSVALEVPRTELQGVPIFAYTKPAIVLFDDVPGGGGVVGRLQEESVLRRVLEHAHACVKGDCGCGPEGSCYACLRTYGNQAVHGELRRGIVQEFLERTLDSWRP